MRTHRLYCPELQIGDVLLPREEAHHATRALRLGDGDEIELFDGRGRHASATISYAKRDTLRATVAEIQEASGYDVPWRLTLAVAFPKAHRQGYLVEKCTELGVSAIWPLISERTVAEPSSKTIERWRRRAIEAAKQSRRAWVPVIETPASIGDTIQRGQAIPLRAFADTGPNCVGLGVLLADEAEPDETLVLIGPEGGWSDQEKEVMRRDGYDGLGLGPTILRTETAAVAVCAAIGAMSRHDLNRI